MNPEHPDDGMEVGRYLSPRLDRWDETPEHTAWLDGAWEPATGGDDEPLPHLSHGHVLGGRYRLEAEHGRVMGSVPWVAFDLKLHRKVLVHVLSPRTRHASEALEAARRAAAATDSRFLRVLDAVIAGPGEPASWIVCEFAPGQSLEQLLSTGPLSALEAAWIVHEIADAMAPLHSRGIFHERLNPESVLVTETGNLKITGLLIDTVLNPHTGDESRTWSDRETKDVTDMGRLLYACLVSRWPVGTGRRPRRVEDPGSAWGLPPAPTDLHGWMTPRQVRAGVSPALDVLCDQILAEVPRHDEVPIRTANEVARSLERTLGSADASADLERRLRYPLGAGTHVEDEEPDLSWLTVPDPLSENPPYEPVGGYGPDEDGYWSPDAAAGEWGRNSAAPRPTTSTAYSPSTPDDYDEEDDQPRITRPRPRNRRWPMLLTAVVAVILVVSLVIMGVRHSGEQGPTASSTPSAIKAAGVRDFDPDADGGDGEENSETARLAIDGRTSTAWHTSVYRNSAALGNLKPGVGLVVDLGRTVEVSSARLTLVGTGTDVSLWRPTDDVTGPNPPMSSIKKWTQVAQTSSAPATVVLEPSRTTRTRFLLVYLTQLPPKTTTRFQGGVAEIEVTGN